MEPKSFGQKLGIGVRVASRIAKEHIDAHTQQAAAAEQAAKELAAKEQAAKTPEPEVLPPVGKQPVPAPEQRSRMEEVSRQAAQTLRQTTQSAAQTARQTARSAAETAKQKAPEVAVRAKGFGVGAKRFGQAMWGPFAHVSSVLWSEITGLFFGLFAFYFAQGIFKYRSAYATGPDHRKFLLDCTLTLLFAYFSVSSFYIARRKEKKKR